MISKRFNININIIFNSIEKYDLKRNNFLCKIRIMTYFLNIMLCFIIFFSFYIFDFNIDIFLNLLTIY